jgi:hypothetical protein
LTPFAFDCRAHWSRIGQVLLAELCAEVGDGVKG